MTASGLETFGFGFGCCYLNYFASPSFIVVNEQIKKNAIYLALTD